MSIVSATLRLYAQAAARAASAFARSAWALVWLLVCVPALALVEFAAAPLGIAGGFLIGFAQAVAALDEFPDDARVACADTSIARVAGRRTVPLEAVDALPCGSPVLWSLPLPPTVPADIGRRVSAFPVRWRGSVPGTPDLRLSVTTCSGTGQGASEAGG